MGDRSLAGFVEVFVSNCRTAFGLEDCWGCLICVNAKIIRCLFSMMSELKKR